MLVRELLLMALPPRIIKCHFRRGFCLFRGTQCRLMGLFHPLANYMMEVWMIGCSIFQSQGVIIFSIMSEPFQLQMESGQSLPQVLHCTLYRFHMMQAL